MALGKSKIGAGGESTDNRNLGLRCAQQIEMTAPADAIADHAGHANYGIEARKTCRHRGDRARDSRCVGDKEHRRVEPFRKLCGRAFIAGRRRRIEQTHHPFDHRDVRIGGRARESCDYRVAIHHPAVEVVRADAGRALVVSGIEIVGAALEGRDLEAARTQRAHQRDSRGSLADAAASRRDDDARNFARGNHRESRYYYNSIRRTLSERLAGALNRAPLRHRLHLRGRLRTQIDRAHESILPAVHLRFSTRATAIGWDRS